MKLFRTNYIYIKIINYSSSYNIFFNYNNKKTNKIIKKYYIFNKIINIMADNKTIFNLYFIGNKIYWFGIDKNINSKNEIILNT